jgi:DNA processing protein
MRDRGRTLRFPRGDPNYPAGLLDLDDSPDVLVLRGALGVWPERSVAIVGARAATRYGHEVASRIAGDLARFGVAVVSGLARGIDAAAHRGALEAGGVTIGVLPGGVHRITPPSHAELAARILETGCIAAEHPEDVPVYRGMFLKRNRLIAALTRVTVVVEAAEQSGALATAAHARRIGRPVLAVPGDVDRPTSRGCHLLLRSGAGVCESVADVIEAIGDHARVARSPGERVLAALEAGPLSLEVLVAQSGVPALDLPPLLLELEWSGCVMPLPGQRWARRIAAA